ncbi:MAG: glyoxalase [Rhodobacteraceae bacterium]|nr:MAG: glyoxalase [Paracoccaceae bacterium]
MTNTAQHALVWAEIPTRDLDKAVAFYKSVFKFDIQVVTTMGPHPIGVIETGNAADVRGHIYSGEPAAAGTGATLHLKIPDTVEAAVSRVLEAGGTVPNDTAIQIPAGRFAYALDLDGNSIGLFEAT